MTEGCYCVMCKRPAPTTPPYFPNTGSTHCLLPWFSCDHELTVVVNEDHTTTPRHHDIYVARLPGYGVLMPREKPCSSIGALLPVSKRGQHVLSLDVRRLAVDGQVYAGSHEAPSQWEMVGEHLLRVRH